MAKPIDRASVLKLGGVAGIAALFETALSMTDADAQGKGNPMNLTVATRPARGRGAGLCYTIVIGEKQTVPSNADLLLQTYASAVKVHVGGNHDWHPTPADGSTSGQWITVYVTPCS